ncbi:hypothetical protein [Aliterella atlantica]|uniref:Uncharacterized protein n=1 Tax=Aliterella atlantica CENA595 TaxID=1618023 RepID=A0A0D8ZYL7_9CYAN|nr:hypothetical protein [Aliterella atlantica]KJH72296.1 hypothetical protein UH38_07685 [Aliterella atlantica CENA595]
MKLKLLAVAVFTSLINMSNTAYASPIWVDLGTSKDGGKVFIDDRSIVKSSTLVKFDMRLVDDREIISSRVIAECNTLAFQYQKKAINNIPSPPPDGIEFPVQEAGDNSVLGTAIYYACAAYRP